MEWVKVLERRYIGVLLRVWEVCKATMGVVKAEVAVSSQLWWFEKTGEDKMRLLESCSIRCHAERYLVPEYSSEARRRPDLYCCSTAPWLARKESFILSG